jgi:hypothetical protein
MREDRRLGGALPGVVGGFSGPDDHGDFGRYPPAHTNFGHYKVGGDSPGRAVHPEEVLRTILRRICERTAFGPARGWQGGGLREADLRVN